jgi:hypothetical protein
MCSVPEDVTLIMCSVPEDVTLNMCSVPEDTIRYTEPTTEKCPKNGKRNVAEDGVNIGVKNHVSYRNTNLISS